MTNRDGDSEKGSHVWHRFFRKTGFLEVPRAFYTENWEEGQGKALRFKQVNEEIIRTVIQNMHMYRIYVYSEYIYVYSVSLAAVDFFRTHAIMGVSGLHLTGEARSI